MPISPSMLHTLCRQDQDSQDRLYKEVVMAEYTGLGVAFYSRITEGSKSGLQHSHGLGWRRDADTGPGSLSSLLKRLQKGDGDLTWEERGRVVDLGVGAITVTTSVTVLRRQFHQLTQQEADNVVRLARSVQVHRCSHHCSSSRSPDQQCGQFFPRPPSLLPLLAMRPALETDEQKVRLEALESISKKMQELLRNLPVPLQAEEDPVASLLSLVRQVAAPPVLQPGGAYYWARVCFPPGQELEHLLQVCGTLATTQEDVVLLGVYHCSLLDRRHAKFLPVRRVGECWGVSYNPWVLMSAKSNVEVELVTHTPQRLYSYLTKGATSQTILEMADEVESRGGSRMGDMAEQIRLVTEEGWREVSLLEAFYRLDPSLHLYNSNCFLARVSVDPFSIQILLYSLR